MRLDGELPHSFSPEVVETLERAFGDVWIVLHAHLQPERRCKEGTKRRA